MISARDDRRVERAVQAIAAPVVDFMPGIGELRTLIKALWNPGSEVLYPTVWTGPCAASSICREQERTRRRDHTKSPQIQRADLGGEAVGAIEFLTAFKFA